MSEPLEPAVIAMDHGDGDAQMSAEERLAHHRAKGAGRSTSTPLGAATLLCREAYIVQEIQTPTEVIVDAWVSFDLFVKGELVATGRAHVRTSAGSMIGDILEVEWPRDYAGPRPMYDDFRDFVGGYYRSLVGPKGSIFRGDPTDIHFVRVILRDEKVDTVRLAGPKDRGW